MATDAVDADDFVRLFSIGDFDEPAWGRHHRVWTGAVEPGRFIGRRDVNRLIEASLLRWPYFTLLRNGKQIPSAECTTSRDVIGQIKHGFPHPGKIRQFMRDGASLKLNQLGDWHRPTARIEKALAAAFRADVTSYVFWTPAGQRGMRAHRDAAHVIAIQLLGEKRWQIYADAGQIASSAGLDVDTGRPSHSFVLHPGDVMYLPHGWPHSAETLENESMHLTFTLATPAPGDLLEAVLATFSDRCPDLVHRHHGLTLAEKAVAVKENLISVARGVETDDWLTTALHVRKQSR